MSVHIPVYVHSNIINRSMIFYIVTGDYKQKLNNICFFGLCSSNVLGDDNGYSTFGDGCYDNLFLKGCYGNIFGNN